MNIERQRLRTHDEDGKLSHAGFVWDEPIPKRRDLFIIPFKTALWTACGIGPFIMFWCDHREEIPTPATIDWILLGVFLLCLCWVVVMLMILPFDFLDRWMMQQVAVSFSSTDEIWLTRPRRMFQPYAQLDWFCIVPPVSEIASIEMNPMKNRVGGHYRHGGDNGYLAYCVHIQFVSGKRIMVGEYFTENEAHIVVAQLNIARREARAAMTVAA